MKLILKLTLFSLFSVSSVGAIAQLECSHSAVLSAADDYHIERLHECLGVLKPCLDNMGFGNDDRAQALQLCALCYVAMDSDENAIRYITELIKLNANYEAEASTPEHFKLLVAYTRMQLKSQTTSSVSKKNGDIELAPATIQIITANDIEDRGYTDVESIFRDLPGFDISTIFGLSYSVLYQRGYRSQSLTDHTLILVDGVEDNYLYTNAALISKQYPISNIKRIEVIYGPASTLYGANAFCGVINIVTKDGDDLFNKATDLKSLEKNKKAAVSVQGGYASYNTKYADGTAAIKTGQLVLTVTGRLYVSDGIDLSQQYQGTSLPDFSMAQYSADMTVAYAKNNAALVGPYFKLNADSTHIIPTSAGIARADSLDKTVYTAKNAGLFRDPVRDACVTAKLVSRNFTLGMQYWNKNEGIAASYNPSYYLPNSQYNNFQFRQYFLYTRYDKTLSDHMNISSLTSYKYSDLGPDSRTTYFYGYGTKALSDTSLVNGQLPYFTTVNYYLACSEISSELKARYDINSSLDIIAGAQFRSDILQANYITSTGLGNPAIINGYSPNSPGGNNVTDNTTSGYVSAGYHNATKHLNADLAERLDYDQFRQNQGYGAETNPRADVVFYPGKFIFKAIYAEAIENGSASTKLAIAASRVSNPNLKPEKVKNIELNTRWKFGKRSYAELAAYRSSYTHTLELVEVPYNGAVATQYQDAGKTLVYGLQAASEIFVARNCSIYANATYNDPLTTFTSVAGYDSSLRTGDIASISANAGCNISFFKNKLNLNTRVNIVGNKPTGQGTSVSTNPLGNIPGYQLLNATVGYYLSKKILWQVGCNNMLNIAYYSPGYATASGVPYAPGVLQPSRNFMTRLIVNY